MTNAGSDAEGRGAAEPAEAVEPAAGAGSPAEPADAAEPGDAATPPTQVRLRRAPRYAPFTLSGVVAGVVVGFVLAVVFPSPEDARYSFNSVAGYLTLSFGLIGGLLGAGVAVLADRGWKR